MASPTTRSTLTPPPVLDQRQFELRYHHWRGWLTALALVLMGAVLAGLVLNFLGMLPWHGPLSTGDTKRTGVTTTFEIAAGDRVAYSLLYLSNLSRVDVVLDSARPVDATPGVNVNAWLVVDTPRCHSLAPDFPHSVPDRCRMPLAGYALPHDQDDSVRPRVIVVLQPSEPGTYRASGFDIQYHVGPIHYTTTLGDGYVIHAR